MTGAWLPDLNGLGDLVRLGVVVVLLVVFGLAFLSGKLNVAIPPPFSYALGLACLAAVIFLLYRGGF